MYVCVYVCMSIYVCQCMYTLFSYMFPVAASHSVVCASVAAGGEWVTKFTFSLRRLRGLPGDRFLLPGHLCMLLGYVRTSRAKTTPLSSFVSSLRIFFFSCLSLFVFLCFLSLAGSAGLSWHPSPSFFQPPFSFCGASPVLSLSLLSVCTITLLSLLIQSHRA